MARSTFYSYFDDKAELIIALGESAMREIIHGAQTIWQLPADASRDQVAAAVRHTIETYLPHTQLMNAVLEVSTYDRRVRSDSTPATPRRNTPRPNTSAPDRRPASSEPTYIPTKPPDG